MAKVLKITACAVAVGVALYGALGYWGVPWVVRTAVEKGVSAKLNRTATLNEVHFNPFTGTLELKGLAVPEPNSDPLLSLDRFYVDLSGRSIFKLAPIVDEITVEGLHINAILNDANRKLLEDLMGGEASSAEKSNTKSSSTENASSGLPKFAISNISISDSSLRYRDSANNIDQSITDLSLKLPFFSTIETSTESLVTPALAFKLNGAAIEATGSTKPFGSTLEAKLGLRVRGLDVAGLARIIPKLNSDALRVSSANLSTNLTFTFRNATGGKPAKMLLSGETTLANLSVTRQGKSMVSLPKAVIDLGELDLVGHNVAVKNVALSGLKVQAERTASGINLLRAFADEPAASVKTPATQTAASQSAKTAQSSTADTWNWSLGTASLTNASIAWNDSTVKPTAKVTLSALTVSGKDFSSEKGRKGSFSLSTDTLGGRFEASGTAEITPLTVDLQAKGTRLTLNAVAPYITQVLGADLRSGVGFDVKAKVFGSDVTASGLATVSDLRLRQGKTSLITLKNGTVQLGSLNTAKRSADVTLVSLDSPVINAILTKKGMNLANLGTNASATTTQSTQKIATAKTKTESAKTTSSELAWSWRLAEAKIASGSLHFTDESVRPTAKADLTKIALSVKNLSSQANTQGAAAFSCDLGGGTVSATGKLGLSPLAADFKIDGNQVGLKPFSSVLAAYAGLGAKTGTFDTTGQLKLTTNKSAEQVIGWKGNMALTDLNLTNASGRALMSWKKAALTDMDVETTKPIRLVIGEVSVDQPAQQQAQTLKGLASLVGAISGNSKTSSKIDKVAGKLDKTLTLKNVRYENGRFSAAGVSAASIEGVILQKFSDTMSSKLGTSTSSSTK